MCALLCKCMIAFCEDCEETSLKQVVTELMLLFRMEAAPTRPPECEPKQPPAAPHRPRPLGKDDFDCRLCWVLKTCFFAEEGSRSAPAHIRSSLANSGPEAKPGPEVIII